MTETHFQIQIERGQRLTMLEAVELPAGVSHLGSGLADVDGDALTHVGG